MRQEILGLLEKGIELHEQLFYGEVAALPAPVYQESNRIVEVDLPARINGILAILNAHARSKKYPRVTSLPQAIELFVDHEIQNDINGAIANKELIGLSCCEDCFVTVKELFDDSKSEIQYLVEVLGKHTSKSKVFQL